MHGSAYTVRTMSRGVLMLFASASALAASAPAPVPPEPAAYAVTTEFRTTGDVPRTTYRLGSKVRVDMGDAGNASAKPTRTLYDLQTMESFSWVPSDASVACTLRTFAPGAWQDPFEGGSDLAMKDVKQTGSETIRGAATVILESDKKPGFRLWVDPQTGLMWKAEFTPQETGKKITYFEVTNVSFKPLPPSTFELPANCSGARTDPPPTK